jgi:lysophospholipid acyltransferase (LPLAT)-like uncharacterized protein
MNWAKRLGKNETLRGTLCRLAAFYIKLAAATGRWRVIGGDIPAAYWDSGKPFIVAFWHGRLLMMIAAWRPGVPVSMLISQHRDGQLIARTIAHAGIGAVTGSSTRGGAGALRAMAKALKAGESIGITPDGPRGPRFTAQPGAVNLAKLSGCPIIPAACSSNPRRLVKSWDRFMVPGLFSTGVFVWGQPIFIARDADDAALEARRLDLEQILTNLANQADALVGQPPVPPP